MIKSLVKKEVRVYSNDDLRREQLPSTSWTPEAV